MDNDYRKIDLPNSPFSFVRVYRDGRLYDERRNKFIQVYGRGRNAHIYGLNGLELVVKPASYFYNACWLAPWRNPPNGLQVRDLDFMGFPMYVAVSDGRIFSKYRMRYILHSSDKNGYCRCILRDKDNRRRPQKVHRIIATAFIPNPNQKPQVDHIDGKKHHNEASNLRWVDNDENQRFRAENRYPSKRLDEFQVIEVQSRAKNGESVASLARRFEVGYATIYIALNQSVPCR